MRKKRKLLLCVCILLLPAGAVRAGMDFYSSRRHRIQQETLAWEREAAHREQGKQGGGNQRILLHIGGMARKMTGLDADVFQEESELHMLDGCAALHEENPPMSMTQAAAEP